MKPVFKDELCNCTTVKMGKYIDGDDPALDIEAAKHFAKAFALWFNEDFFDKESQWLVIEISYVNDHFFKEELIATIKFFMQFHDYSFLNSKNDVKPIDGE